MEPSTVVRGPEEGLLSRDTVPFAASAAIINKTSEQIPEHQSRSYDKKSCLEERNTASFYAGGMGGHEVNSGDPAREARI